MDRNHNSVPVINRRYRPRAGAVNPPPALPTVIIWRNDVPVTHAETYALMLRQNVPNQQPLVLCHGSLVTAWRARLSQVAIVMTPTAYQASTGSKYSMELSAFSGVLCLHLNDEAEAAIILLANESQIAHKIYKPFHG